MNTIQGTYENHESLRMRMMQGDSRCPIQIDDRVEKINTEPGDATEDGHLGYCRGNTYIGDGLCAYLVEWDGLVLPAEVNGDPVIVPYVFIGSSRVKKV